MTLNELKENFKTHEKTGADFMRWAKKNYDITFTATDLSRWRTGMVALSKGMQIVFRVYFNQFKNKDGHE